MNKAQQYTLSVAPRTVTGKKVSQLRAKHVIPANIFGNTESKAIQVEEKVLFSLLDKAGETTLIQLSVDGESSPRPVLIANVLRSPVRGDVLHVDFQQVDLSQKVTAPVPFEVTGESEAVKAGGVLVIAHDEIEVEALPTDLPEKFVLDISSLTAVGQDLTVAALQYDKSKVEVKLPPEEILVTIQEQAKEEVVVVAEPIETETTVQGKSEDKEGEEGAAPAAGDKADKAEKKEEKK